jgi:hypothetical protein
MRVMRNRASLVAAAALVWHMAAITSVVLVMSADLRAMSQEAGGENCPLHSKPACPLHGEKHGTHDCDCPTIGCSQTDVGFTALFGAIGVLPAVIDAPAPFVAGENAPALSQSPYLFARVPISPPPRA